ASTYEPTEEDAGLTLRVVGSVPGRLAPKASAATAIVEEPEREFGEFEETPEEESATREREELESEEGTEPAFEMPKPFFDLTPFAERNSSNEWKILHYFKVPPASGYRHYTTLREGRPPGTANPKKEVGWGWRKIQLKHPEVTIKKIGEVLANPSIPPEVHGSRFTYVLEEVKETTGCGEGGCIDEFKGTEWRVVVERKIQEDDEESGVITAYAKPVDRTTIDIF
ncbi:MAG TPA: hypothetical protein VKV16_10030, partial [Solirubrobacteraceae bacterium]|nr:hypothetical protein [Solirubrobacteraceae bacterium]